MWFYEEGKVDIFGVKFFCLYWNCWYFIVQKRWQNHPFFGWTSCAWMNLLHFFSREREKSRKKCWKNKNGEISLHVRVITIILPWPPLLLFHQNMIFSMLRFAAISDCKRTSYVKRELLHIKPSLFSGGKRLKIVPFFRNVYK